MHHGVWVFKEGRYLNSDMLIFSSYLVVKMEKNVCIFFEINVADEKSEHLSSIWCLRLVSLHLPTQLPSSNDIL